MGSYLITCLQPFVFAVTFFATAQHAAAQQIEDQWRYLFPSTPDTAAGIPGSLTLEMTLQLVARSNSSLLAGRQRVEASRGLVRQAGLRPNPELALEAEDFGGGLSGFRESALTFGLSQELELWGKRRTRQDVALRDMEATGWETRVAAFDIYTEAKSRFYTLFHVQRKVELAEKAADLAADVAEAARTRVEKGAASTSELLLARLDVERANVQLAQARTELTNARLALAALWKGDGGEFIAVGPDLSVLTLPDTSVLESFLAGTRDVLGNVLELRRVEALLNFEKANGRPNLTVSGGLRRLESDGANTFVVGLSLPLPFFNRNQGNISSLQMRSDAIKSTLEQALADAEAELKIQCHQMSQFFSNRTSLDTLLLPTAEEAYLSLRRAYELGKIPYTNLLEGERSLIGLRFELNDLDLAIREKIISIERLLGINLEDLKN